MEKLRIYAFADEASAAIDGQIDAMRRNALSGLEIRNVDSVNVSDISLEKAREVRGKLDDCGLEVWSIGSPIGKIDIVKDDFAVHLDKLRHTIEVADALNAKNIRLFSFYTPKNENPENYRAEVVDRIGAMLDAANGSGIDLCHENEKGIYGDIATRCAELHRAFPALKAVFDPANFIQCGQETLQAWQALKPYVKYMHIKDALKDGSVVPAGKGVGHVAQILWDYRKSGGSAVTLEPHLKVFEGLAALERPEGESVVGTYCYESNDAAFDAACAALNELL